MASRMVPEGGWSNLKQRAPRERKQSHLEFIAALPCVCCATTGLIQYGCDAAHIRTASALHGKRETGGGERPSDRWCLPLCRRHHDQQHSVSNERNFWSMYRIDPFLLALILWGITGDDYAATEVLRLHAGGR